MLMIKPYQTNDAFSLIMNVMNVVILDGFGRLLVIQQLLQIDHDCLK